MKPDDLYCRTRLSTSGLPQYIESLGGNPAALLRKAGIDASALQDKFHVALWPDVCRFYELVAETLEEPYFGIKWAMNMPKDFRASGATLFQLFVAPDFRRFLKLAFDYQKLNNNGITFRLSEDKQSDMAAAILSPHPLSPACRQICEAKLVAAALVGQRYIDGLVLDKVTFQYSAPKDLSLYTQAFKCPIEFNAEQNAIVANKSFLDGNNKRITKTIMAPFVRSYFHHQVRKNPKSQRSVTLMAYEVIPSVLGLGASDLPHIAEAVSLHPKKLQRLLLDEGTSYSEVLDDVRKNMAERFLRDSDISIQKIACMLDYASDRTFAKASKRWFAMSPSQYRKSVRNA